MQTQIQSTKFRHHLSPELLNRRVKVLVVGAGGTGSHIVADLAVLHQSMLDLGHPHGLHVTVSDFDDVSSANVGRARFYESDVGKNKAAVLVQRINMCFGLDFAAQRVAVSAKSGLREFDIVVGCVDTRASRRAIWQSSQGNGMYWLDLGNGSDDGQVILGQTLDRYSRDEANRGPRLPCVVELYPEMLNAKNDPKDTGPSCSRAEALRKQSAFVNKTAALNAVSMLSTLFRQGYLDHHAIFFDVRRQKSSVLACDTAVWARFGYKVPVQEKEEEMT
jgi:PRTRC genetic system ThiF family protein